MVTGDYIRVSVVFMLVCQIPVTLQACFSTSCPRLGSLQECTQGSWLCQANEFCDISTLHATGFVGSILPYQRQSCRPADQLQDCQAMYTSNDPACQPDQHNLVCHWCCADANCVHFLATTGHIPVAGERSCFDTHCPRHGSLGACSRGQWLCHKDEFCEITMPDPHTINHNGIDGEFIMACRSNQMIRDCLAAFGANDQTCHPDQRHSQISDCSWCCANETCVHEMASGHYVPPVEEHASAAPGTTLTTTQTTSTTTTTTTITTTPVPTTTQEECVDRHHGDCAAQFSGMCDETLVQYLCAKTCHLC